MDLWIVGREYDYNSWEFCGVFGEERLAVDACTTSTHFVGPATLDERLPDIRVRWPGAYFPLAKYKQTGP